MTETERYKAALEIIGTKLGRVCEQFELCTHRSCADSCAACLIAKDALDGTFDPETWPG